MRDVEDVAVAGQPGTVRLDVEVLDHHEEEGEGLTCGVEEPDGPEIAVAQGDDFLLYRVFS
jgi:hypothetical protein